MENRFWRTIVVPLIGNRVTVEGIKHVPTAGAFIVAANHQSYTDPVQIAFALYKHRGRKGWFLTTEHIWKTFKMFGGIRTLRWLGMIPIINSQKAEALDPAIGILRSSGIICIFPEGGRNKPSVNPQYETALLKGRTGTARLALATGVPVIPAGIIAPKGLTAWQAIVNFLFRKQPAVVRFGPPLSFGTEDLTTVSKDRLVSVTQEVMLAIAERCGKEYPY